jgi:integrase/recombinase XerD
MKDLQTSLSNRSIPMTEEAMSPLRRRMIEDMTIRRLAPKTQEGYIRTIKNFAVFSRSFAGHGKFEMSAAFNRRRATSAIRSLPRAEQTMAPTLSKDRG